MKLKRGFARKLQYKFLIWIFALFLLIPIVSATYENNVTETWSMDLDRDNFVIEREYEKIYISVRYKHVFNLFAGNHINNHVFFYEVEEEIKAGGVLREDRGY